MIAAPPPHTPLAPPPSPPPPVALGRRRPQPEEQRVDCTAAWAMIGILCAFKVATIAIIYFLAYPSAKVGVVLLAMNWPWLIIFGVLLAMLPFGFWFRMVRARSRRRRLQYAEWNVRG